ncbi:1706_t:CDS:2 [Acaulospora colombiana]|uniref:1706_t:CDS:1 n=1 Tax=Acaulospora colombiana TaxID=27376 RepID=A0ACA9K0Z0_9GLOM|nr:1706_t:CDS:2 [Acaulospora colombiana]
MLRSLYDLSLIKFYKKYVSLHTSREEAEASLLALLKTVSESGKAKEATYARKHIANFSDLTINKKCDQYWDDRDVKMAKRRAEKRGAIHDYHIQYNVYQEHDVHSTRITKLTGEKRKDVTDKDETSHQKVAKKKSKIDELFQDMRKRNIYMLCGPFKKLSELDAEDRFENIVRNATIEIDFPKDIKEYLHDLLSGDIKSALSKVKEPLSEDARPLLLWTNEVCRHFIFYFHYGGLQIDGDEKTWSNQTIYRIIDLFSVGEITNEAHKDRIYTINVNQKPSNSRRGDKNDAVLYQDDNATIVYEQSFGPTEFDSTHYMEDITKLARNGVDDLNYHFLNPP